MDYSLSVIERKERWLAQAMMLTGVTSNPTPSCRRSRNSSGKRSRKGRFASVRILTAAFGSCRFALPKAVAEVIEPSPVPTHLTNTSSMTTGVFASIECFKFAGMWTHVPA